MAVAWSSLDREKFKRMSSRETVQNVPNPGYSKGPSSLTKKQIATLVLIYNADSSGYGQIRNYPQRPGRHAMPSPSVPETLDKKGFVDVGDKKQVSRRTGRGPSGFEKKKEGGYVTAYQSNDLLDALAQKLGFKNRFDDQMARFMRQQMEQM